MEHNMSTSNDFQRQPHSHANLALNSPSLTIVPRIVYPSQSRIASSQSPPTSEVGRSRSYQTSWGERGPPQPRDGPGRLANRRSSVPILPRWPVEIHAGATLMAPNRSCGPPGYPTPSPQSPSQGVCYPFITVDPSTKASNGGVAYVRPRGQTEEDRRHKRMLRENGGSCIWCVQRRKPCDLEKVCAWCKENGLPCLRSSEQIWLYETFESSPRCRQTAIRRAKENTFIRANKVMEEFRTRLIGSNFVAQNPSAQATLKIRCGQLDSSNLVLLDQTPPDIPWNHFDLSKAEKVILLNAICSSIPFPPLPHIHRKTAHYDIFLLATTIFRSVAFAISITGTGLHGRPACFGLAKIALADLLVSLAKFIAQHANDFCSRLCTTLRPSKTKPVPQNINVAIRVYHQVLVALSNFKPGFIIRQIFSGILAQVPASLSLMEQLLATSHFSTGETEMPLLYVPNSFQLAVSLDSENGESVPTPIDQQFAPFSSIPIYTVSELLIKHSNLDPQPTPNEDTLASPPVVYPSHPDYDMPRSPSFNGSGSWVGPTFQQTMTRRHSPSKGYDPHSGVDVNHASIDRASSRSSQRQTLAATESSASTYADDDGSDEPNAEPEHLVDKYFKCNEFIRDFEAGVCGTKGGLSVDFDTLANADPPHLQDAEDAHELGLT